MFELVEGMIFHLYAETEQDAVAQAKEFYGQGGHDNDVVAVNGLLDEPIYLSKSTAMLGYLRQDGFVYFTRRMFKDARLNSHLAMGGIIPALNELGEPVCLIRKKGLSGYVHDYTAVNDVIDIRPFELYDNVVLNEITEHAFILLKDALSGYSGKIVLAGEGWQDFKKLFPERDEIIYVDSIDQLPPDVVQGKTMYLMEFMSNMAGWDQRVKEGFFSYDEVMSVVYCFAKRKSYGDKHPDKKFFLVNPGMTMEGLMSVCDKVQTPYAYAKANGFIPVIRLTQSDRNIYSDKPRDDIWSKFFVQPYGEEASEWSEACNVWEFPYSTITFSARWLMTQIVKCEPVSFMNTNFINERVRVEIDKVREGVLLEPEKTIGVLIRGTDYTTSAVPGHSVMATPEQVMEKILELEASGEYGNIFLSTEDEDILEKMKQLCGDKLTYIDQKRFKIKAGELLADQAKERENEGWLKGKEYLTTLKLLSECKAFIASGGCCGTTCALNSGKDNFKESFVFDLGRN
ncbi:MAG: hypothetical protein IKJ73_07315 [Lachnospiraceae bacterium]|nr:hypothetical protein [Lachnospiraceae bacterium]